MTAVKAGPRTNSHLWTSRKRIESGYAERKAKRERLKKLHMCLMMFTTPLFVEWSVILVQRGNIYMTYQL